METGSRHRRDPGLRQRRPVSHHHHRREFLRHRQPAFTLKIRQPPTITTARMATAVTGTAFSFQVTATGFPAPKITEAGRLPTGVRFRPATATFGGTPRTGTSGVYTITITATSTSGTFTQQFILIVSPGND